MRSVTRAGCLVLAVVIGASSSVHASTVTVDFDFLQANAAAGSDAGAPFSGSLSFDDAPYAPGSSNFDTENGLPTLAIDFDWLGTHWTAANARIFRLDFDLGRSLIGWGIAGAYLNPTICGVSRYGCVVSFGNTESDFFVNSSGASLDAIGEVPSEEFNFAASSEGHWSVRAATPVTVPEPSSIALMTLALAGLMLMRRRRHQQRTSGAG